MKAICKLNTTVEGNKITMTGELVDVILPPIVGQRHSIAHAVAGNPSKPRQLQMTSHGVVVLRKGATGVLFPKDELVSAQLEIDSNLTDAPTFLANPTPANLTGKVASEIAATAVIQQSDDGITWIDAPDNVMSVAGKYYRCIATNKNGSTTSKSFNIPLPKPASK